VTTIVLGVRPVRKEEYRLEIVKNLSNSAEEVTHVDSVLMDREFDSQHVPEAVALRRRAQTDAAP